MPHALIVRVGAIGDVLLVLPAAKLLHDRGFSIDWVCGSAAAPILRLYPWLSVFEIDDRALFRASKLRRLAVLLALWIQIARRPYDLCALLHYDRRYRLLTLPVRAHRRLALHRHDRRFRLLDGRWMAEEFARILASAAGFAHDGFRESSISLLRPENFPPLASPLALSSDFAHTIALVPGGAKNILRDDALRRWPVENYAALAQLLIARGHRVILTGAPDDAWTLPAFQPLLASHPHALLNRIGSTSLPELLALYDSCSLVITHDTGSMHIAGISRAAVLAIFGPTNPANVLPRRDRVKALWGGATLPCRPCFDGRNFAPCSFNGCVREITPAHVAAEAEAILSARAFSS